MTIDLRQAIAIVIAIAGVGFPSVATADQWLASELRGTVLYYEGDHWQEAAPGQNFGPGDLVRTLQAGGMVLSTSKTKVVVKPGTALGFGRGKVAALTQYAGEIEVTAGGDGLHLSAPGLAAEIGGGRARSIVHHGSASLTMLSGTARLRTADQRLTWLAAGQTFDSGSGAKAPAAETNSLSPNELPDSGVSAPAGSDASDGNNSPSHNGSGNGNNGNHNAGNNGSGNNGNHGNGNNGKAGK